MPKLNIQEPHSLDERVAYDRIKNLLSDLKDRFSDQISNVTESWNGNTADFSFKAMGFSIKGQLKVSTNQVELKGSLPLAAMPFRGIVENAIRTQARELLDA